MALIDLSVYFVYLYGYLLIWLSKSNTSKPQSNSMTKFDKMPEYLEFQAVYIVFSQN